MQTKSKRIYDYVIVGAGLGGLAMATALSKVSQSVLLLDGADVYGGVNHPVTLGTEQINNGLRFLPNTELGRKAMRFLQGLLAVDVSITAEDCAPVTFEAGGLKPFLSFGDTTPAFYEEMSYFLSPERLTTSLAVCDWPAQLFTQFRGEFAPRSYVTKFQAVDGRIDSLMVNGQRVVHGYNFIFCGQISDLPKLLPEEALSPRARQRISKGKFASAICLDLLHGDQVTENFSTHVLNGTTEDDSGPCVGRFYPAAAGAGIGAGQSSQWVSFIDNDDAEESENVATALKKIKRQIKRVYPQAFEKQALERIFVSPSIGGNADLKLAADQSLPGMSNLWIASGPMQTQRNLLGTLLQVELVCSALSCHPAGVQVAEPEPEASV